MDICSISVWFLAILGEKSDVTKMVSTLTFESEQNVTNSAK